VQKAKTSYISNAVATSGRGLLLMLSLAAFLAALQSAATYQLNGTRLELRRADGALAVSFVR
jgi:hypothetical protein